MTFDHFLSIETVVEAADGGSKGLLLAGPSGQELFWVVRSISSRGSTTYGKVHINGRDGPLLSLGDTLRLCHRLRQLNVPGGQFHSVVSAFIQTAEHHAAL